MENKIGADLPVEMWTQIGNLLDEDLAVFSEVSWLFYRIVGGLVEAHKKMIEQIEKRKISLFKEAIKVRYFENRNVRVEYRTFSKYLFRFQRSELSSLKVHFPSLRLAGRGQTFEDFIEREKQIEGLNLFLFTENTIDCDSTPLSDNRRVGELSTWEELQNELCVVRSALWGMRCLVTCLHCKGAGLTRIPPEHTVFNYLVSIDFRENQIWRLPRECVERATYYLNRNPADVVGFQLSSSPPPYPSFLLSERQLVHIRSYKNNQASEWWCIAGDEGIYRVGFKRVEKKEESGFCPLF